MSLVPVYRAPMWSRQDDVPRFAAVERALRYGVVGVGGRLDARPAGFVDAVTAVAAKHGERVALRLERFASVPEGAYVWTRDSEENFWLGTLAGEWRYDDADEAFAVDLVHVRSTDWLDAPVRYRDVPPAVLATFARGGRNWQQTHDADASRISAALWEVRP